METMAAIIDKCRKAKNEKGYSYEYIAEKSGIPKSTVERFFSAKGTSCRYDTIYPIVRFLIGFDEPTPPSQSIAKEMPLPMNEMIDWYKDVITKREAEAERLKAEHKAEIAELKAEHKQAVIELKKEHSEDLAAKHKTNIRLWITLTTTLVLVILLIIVDTQIRGIGWFR